MNNKKTNMLIIFIILGAVLLTAFLIYRRKFATRETVVVRIDASKTEGPVELKSGILGSTLSLPYIPDSLIKPLKIPFWRGKLNDASYERAIGLGVKYDVVLTDLWCKEKTCFTNVKSVTDKTKHEENFPWKNLDEWRQFVYDTVKETKDSGKNIKYWEPINEPLNTGFWSPNDKPKEVFEAYKLAYQAIKEADPDAWVGGPGFESYDKVMIERFLAAAVKEGVGVDFLIWHELHGQTAEIPNRANEIRSIVNQKYSQAGVKEYHINEIIGPNEAYSPAVALATFAALEKAQIDYSAKACWSSVECAIFLDGLLTSSPEISDDQLRDLLACVEKNECKIEDILQKYQFVTRPVWWVYKAYADTNEDTRIQSNIKDQNLIVLPSISQDKKAIRILVGRYAEANQKIAAKNISLAIDNLPQNVSNAKVKIEKIPADQNELKEPIVLSDSQSTINNQELFLDLQGLSKDEVILITINL